MKKQKQKGVKRKQKANCKRDNRACWNMLY